MSCPEQYGKTDKYLFDSNLDEIFFKKGFKDFNHSYSVILVLKVWKYVQLKQNNKKLRLKSNEYNKQLLNKTILLVVRLLQQICWIEL